MKKILALIISFLFITGEVAASSGSLKTSTIKECEGNLYGQHGEDNHWHIAIKNENGSYTAKGDALKNDPCPIENKEKNNDENKDKIEENVLSSDTSLKEIIIDGNSVEIADTMEYKTTNKKIDLSITANDNEAKIEYNKLKDLELGNNIVSINVTAPDNTKNKYVLIIVREEELDNNTNIEIKINNEKIEFENNIFEIEVKNDVTELDIDYILESKTSTVEIIDNENFVIGKNEVKIIVTAENGEKQEYIIKVTKLDLINSIIKIILGSSVVVTILAFVKKITGK